MSYGLAADAVVLVHALFVLFVVFGGMLVWRWPRLLGYHLVALGWGASVELFGLTCPLTPLENMLRHEAGLAGYEGGFVEHYVLPVLYPPGLTHDTQLLLGALLVAFNLLVYACHWIRKKPDRGSSE